MAVFKGKMQSQNAKSKCKFKIQMSKFKIQNWLRRAPLRSGSKGKVEWQNAEAFYGEFIAVEIVYGMKKHKNTDP